MLDTEVPYCCRSPETAAAVRVAMAGELDINTVPELDRALRRAEAHGTPVILDLRELDFLDGAGAKLLLATDRRIRRAGGRLIIIRGPVEVDWFFWLIGIDSELDFVDQAAAPAILALLGLAPLSALDDSPARAPVPASATA